MSTTSAQNLSALTSDTGTIVGNDIGVSALSEPIAPSGITSSINDGAASKVMASVDEYAGENAAGMNRMETSKYIVSNVSGPDVIIQRAQDIASGKVLTPVSGRDRALNIYENVQDASDRITPDAKLKASHEEVKRILKSCLLGYGSYNLMTNDSFGSGPKLARQRYNARQINQTGIKSLLRMHSTGTLQRDSSDDQKMIILVVSSGLITANTLLQSPVQGLFPMINWVSGAKELAKSNPDLVAAVANGNHRCTVTETLSSASLEKLLKVKKEIENYKTFQTGTDYSKVNRETVRKLEKDIEDIGTWNCIVYDLEKIEAHEKRDTLLLSLSENDIFFNQPDTNQDSLHHLLTSMVGKSDEVVEDMLQAHRQGRVAKPSPVDSVFKDKSALISYASPYAFEALSSEHLWKPLQLLHWQSCASTITLPYLRYMVRILGYLANYDTQFDPKDEHFIRKRVLSMTHKSDLSANVLNASFFHCLDDAYMQNLKPAISTFGIKQDITNVQGETKVAEDLSDSEVLNSNELMEIDQRPVADIPLNWDTSFVQYTQDLCLMLEKWASKRLNDLSDQNDAEDPKRVQNIIGQIIPKIKAIIMHKPYLSSVLLPAVSSPPPFFTRFWYGDLSTSVANAGPGIELLYTCYDPCLYYVMNNTNITLDNKDRSYNISKAPTLFGDWIDAMYYDEDNDFDWYKTTKRLVVRNIHALVFNFRESLLLELGIHTSVLSRAFTSWKDIPKYASVKQYKDKVAKDKAKNEYKVPRDGLEDGVLAAQIIHEWRMSAQKEESLSLEPELMKHHHDRIGRSKLGPLNRPSTSCIPAKYNESSDELTIDIVSVLSDTAYNWANWINGRQTSKGVGSARFVMAILEAREQVVAIMNSAKYRPVIFLMEYWLGKFESETRTRATWIQELEESDGMGDIDLDTLNKAADVPMPHQVAVVSEKDKIELELRATLLKLSNLAGDYGKINHQWNAHVANGFENLALASCNFITFNFCDFMLVNLQGFTEVGLWKQGQYGGAHPAKRGPINRKVLKEFLADIRIKLPMDEHIGDTLFFASALPIINVAEMNDQISVNRPSTIDYRLLLDKRNKGQKARSGKKGKKGKKGLVDDALARQDLEIMTEFDPDSMKSSSSSLESPTPAQSSKRRRPSVHTSQASPRVGKKIRANDPGTSSSHQTAFALNHAFTSNDADGDFNMHNNEKSKELMEPDYMDEDFTPGNPISPAGSLSDVEFNSS